MPSSQRMALAAALISTRCNNINKKCNNIYKKIARI
jgi:hypothetical protein